MTNINVAVNKTLADLIKAKVAKAGYSNVSEYIRDLLRHDLKLVHHIDDDYPYDYEYIKELVKEAKKEYKAGHCIEASSVDEALKKLKE